MARAYTPGPEADAIVEQQLANGRYGSADEVVRVALELLEQSEAELDALSRMIEADAAAYARGRDGPDDGDGNRTAGITPVGDRPQPAKR